MIIGESEAILELKEKIAVIAPSSASVIVFGETGTGKELIANELHNQSERRKYKLVKVNCAAIQDTLLESELFGHVKGAFTDASTKKLGKMQIADGGTLVLDEISNMSWTIQAKILRAVENQQFEMVGGTESFKIDTRFVSLSNQDMLEMVEQNKFRQDLFYRLSTVTLTVPPLRERKADIPALTRHFVTFYREKYGKEHIIKTVSTAALDKLISYHWPGNIRELRNLLEQTVLFCFEEKITEEMIKFNNKYNPLNSSVSSKELITHTVQHLSTNGYHKQMQRALDDIELTWIENCLKQTDNVQKTAAKLMGVSPRVMCYKLKYHRERTGKEIGHGVSAIPKAKG